MVKPNKKTIDSKTQEEKPRNKKSLPVNNNVDPGKKREPIRAPKTSVRKYHLKPIFTTLTVNIICFPKWSGLNVSARIPLSLEFVISYNTMRGHFEKQKITSSE